MTSHVLTGFRSGDDLPGDLTPAMRRFLATHAAGDWRLELGGGQHDLFPESAPETEVFISNNDSGRVKSPFLLSGLSDVEIDGQGAALSVRGTPLAGRGRITLLDTPMLPFVLHQCRNVTLRRFSIDWRTPFAVQACITEVTGQTITVELDTTQRCWTWTGRLYVEGEGWCFPVQRVLAVDSATGAIIQGGGDNIGGDYELNWVFDRLDERRVTLSGPFRLVPEVGNVLLFWLAGFDTGGRRSPAIFVSECENVVIEDVVLHHAWGMGVIAQRTDGIALRRVVVEPSGSRLFSLTADATHFVGCRGELSIEACRFQNQFDDGVNIHGIYLQVVRALDTRRLRVRTGHPQHQGVPCVAVGDRIGLVRAGSLATYFETTVETVEALNSETRDISVADDLPADIAAADVVEATDWYPETTIRETIFRWNRARGVLLGGRRPILVQGCYFETPGNAIRAESDSVYFEAGPINQLTVRDNHFVNCAHGAGWGSAVVEIVPGIREQEAPPFHDEVHVVDNCFEKLNGSTLITEHTRSFLFENNRDSDGLPVTADGSRA